MKRKSIRDGLSPWAGIMLGTLGAGLAHQIGSDSTFQDCTVGSPWIVILGAIIGLTLVAAGAFLSYGVFVSKAAPPARKMLSVVSLLASALFVMAIVLPLIASLVIPQCWA